MLVAPLAEAIELRVPGVDVQATLEGRLIFEIHLLSALKLWRHGPEYKKFCLEHGGQSDHVFEQLGGSQRVRCHEHVDVGIETVCHAERELQSNL